MNIIEHGTWSPYEPTEDDPDIFKGYGGIIYARRDGDRKGWYKYIRDEKTFKPDSVKATVYLRGDQYRVGAATTDVSRLFPGMPKTLLIEITGYSGADPQEEFGNKVYDPKAKTFTADEPSEQLNPIERMQAQIDELRALIAQKEKQ